jgi:hypothetical protein
MLFQPGWSRRLFAGAGLGLCVAAIAVANLGHAADRVESSSGVEVLPFDPNASCEAINQWIALHREVLPSTLSAISRYPMRYRRAIVASLPLDTRIDLWTAHRDMILATRPLNESQRRFLQDTRVRIPEWHRLPADREAERHLRKAAIDVLGDALAREAISALGEAESVEDSAPPLACSCSRQSDWCAAGARCESLACNVVAGCGSFWVYQCDGLCYRDQS